jgi:hypothetical protein
MSAVPIPPIPPFKKDAIIPGAADKPEKDKPASPLVEDVSTKPPKYTKKNQLTNNQKNVLDKIQNFFVTPISYFTGVIGLLSFALPNFLIQKMILLTRLLIIQVKQLFMQPQLLVY